jgi:endoglycosylceramidase
MAVTLTSTGITFSDGSTQNAAASGGGAVAGSYQLFTSGGNWNRPSTDINQAFVEIIAGGGGGASYRWTGNGGGTGGSGGKIIGLVPVNGNTSVTVGGAGNGGPYFSATPGNAGGASSCFGLTAGGGNGGNPNPAGGGSGNPGNHGAGMFTGPNPRGTDADKGIGGAGVNRPSSSPGQAGTAGYVSISW